MKKTFAILSSLLLVWAQGVLAAGAPFTDFSPHCQDCACGTMSCCVAPSPAPAPATPAPAPRSVAPDHSVVLLALTAQPQTLVAQVRIEVFSVPRVPSPVPPVPLYRRNCAWLI